MSPNNFTLPQGFIQKKRKQLTLAQLNLFPNKQQTNFNSIQENNFKNSKTIQQKAYCFNQYKSSKQTLLQQKKKIKKLQTLVTKQLFSQQNQILRRTSTQRIQDKKDYNKKLKNKPQKFVNLQLFKDYIPTVNLEVNEVRQKIVYVDLGKLRKNQSNEVQSVQIENQTEKKDQTKGKAIFENFYSNRNLMYELNKPLHQKNTYRFNVMWWQDKMRQQIPKQSNTNKEGGCYLDEETRKNLKKQLKPLRKHKLYATRFAPLSEFARQQPTQMDGKYVESSQEEEQVEKLQQYDNQNEQEADNFINLQKNKDSKDSKQGQSIKFGIKRRSKPTEQPVLHNRLKRALKNMEERDWRQDRLFTRGAESKPIITEDLD